MFEHDAAGLLDALPVPTRVFAIGSAACAREYEIGDVEVRLGAQIQATLPTGVLNRVISEAYQKYHPPAYKRRIPKIYYSTQVGVSPLRIRLFVKVKNTGKGTAFRTITTLKNLSGVGIFIRKGRFILNKLSPGETKTASFWLDVQNAYAMSRFKVELTVYDLAGRMVKPLVSEHVTVGDHEAHWDGRDQAGNRVASGVYLYQLRTDEFAETKRMVLLK